MFTNELLKQLKQGIPNFKRHYFVRHYCDCHYCEVRKKYHNY
jgi:hypothetical protein